MNIDNFGEIEKGTYFTKDLNSAKNFKINIIEDFEKINLENDEFNFILNTIKNIN